MNPEVSNILNLDVSNILIGSSVLLDNIKRELLEYPLKLYLRINLKKKNQKFYGKN